LVRVKTIARSTLPSSSTQRRSLRLSCFSTKYTTWSTVSAVGSSRDRDAHRIDEHRVREVEDRFGIVAEKSSV
jgi:hypothetical protein